MNDLRQKAVDEAFCSSCGEIIKKEKNMTLSHFNRLKEEIC